jgi:hypothetical protein
MDLFFQGRACWNKGLAPEHVTQARDFFERALALDPDNIGAMVFVAAVDLVAGSGYQTDNRAGAPRGSRDDVYKGAVSRAPNHALAHLGLGVVQSVTNRVAQGVAEYARALALDRNLADAHALIGEAKIYMGRGAETEAHINEAFRLSPRDISAFRWLMYGGFAKVQVNADYEAVFWFRRSIEANRNYPLAHFGFAAALALLGSLDQAKTAAQAGLAIDPAFTIRRFRDGASSDNPTYIAKRERIYEGMRMAGVPEGLMSEIGHERPLDYPSLCSVRLPSDLGFNFALRIPTYCSWQHGRRPASRPRPKSSYARCLSRQCRTRSPRRSPRPARIRRRAPPANLLRGAWARLLLLAAFCF